MKKKNERRKIHSTLDLFSPMQRLAPPKPPLPARPGRSARSRTISTMSSLADRSMDAHSAAASGAALSAAAAERNKAPILAVLAPRLPASGHVLELASGTGQHVAHFAAATPGLTWHPTDVDDSAFASIAAHCAGLDNVRPPVVLDACTDPADWPRPGTTDPKTDATVDPPNQHSSSFAAIYAANVTHIAPWEVTLGLLTGAAAVLAPGGRLFLYGPFAVNGRPATASDAAFDASLRARNAAWGYRDARDEVAVAAEGVGLHLEEVVDMPANNFVLVFCRRG